jgi:hypothetical protein
MSATLIIYPLDDSGQEVAFELDCEDVAIAMTLTVQDITDVTKRRGSFSKTINLNGTDRNNAAFGYAYNIQSFVGGFTPNRRIRAALWDNGIQTFSGSLQLLSIKKTGAVVTYEVGIYSEEVAFFRQIAETLLSNTAGVSGFNHTLTAALASGTWVAPAGSGYVYGFLDGAGYSDVSPTVLDFFQISLMIPYLELVPSFYIKQLIDLIFAEKGYRYQSAFFNTSLFKKLVLPYAGGARLQNDLSGENSKMEGSELAGGEAGAANWDDIGFNAFFANTIYAGIFPFDTVITDPQLYWDTATYEFRNVPYYSSWDVSYAFTLTNLENRNVRIGFAICDASTGLPINESLENTIVDFIEPNETRKFEFQGTVRLEPNQVIDLRCFYVDLPFSDYPIEIETDATITMVCIENMGVSVAADMVRALPPDITQADLLSDLQKMFNLYFYVSPVDPNLIYIEPFTSFYASGSVDWTQKIDTQGEQSIMMGDPESRKSILFKYRDSGDALGKLYSDTFKEGYGSRDWQTDNYYAKGEQVVETKCATVIPASFRNGLIIGRTFDIDSNNRPKARANGYRIAQFNYVAIPSSVPWVLLINTTPTFALFTSLPFISHVDNPYAPTFDLAFGMPKNLYFKAFSGAGYANYDNTNLFNTYWRNYIIETTSKESLQIELDVLLDPVDIYNLDFRAPVYIGGVLFRLLEIKDYVIGGKQKCRALLRRILNLAAPSTGAVPTLTYFDSSDLVLDEMKPQVIAPNNIGQ